MKKMQLLLLSAMVGACATGGTFNTQPGDIPRLEQQATARPGDANASTALGIAYFRANRYEDARTALERAVQTGNAVGAAHMYLGLANEELKNYTAARTAYETYLASGADDNAAQIRARLALVARQELRVAARAVLEREQQMTDDPPTPRTVAVLPFRLVGTGEDLAPLQAALSDMIITDLSVSPAITSVERVRINAMVDEMLLAQAGLAEAATGARVGRLLKAEHVVQGIIAQSSPQQIRMDATVLNTQRREAAGSFGREQQMAAIFDLEKEIVFNIFSTLGVTLTAAERERINENRTGNLLAFLAYGRGLEAMDAGNYQQATQFFRQAAQLDPDFDRAEAQQQQAAQLEIAVLTNAQDLVNRMLEMSAFNTETFRDQMSDALNPSGATEVTGSQAAEVTPPSAPTNTAQNQSGNVQTAQGSIGGVTDAAKANIQIRIANPTRGQ
jgi:tetratricopeptide (TPR) repeat protein